MLAGAALLAGLLPASGAISLRPAVVARNHEAALLADADDGRLDEFTLVHAALVAGGVEDPQVWRRAEERLQGYARELKASGRLAGSAEEQARAIHAFLHDRVLSSYDPSANNLADVLAGGRFNCITSSTLYMALAAECGLPAAAYELPAHVLVVLDPQGAAVPVETTCPRWRPARPGGERPATPGRLIDAAQLLATYYHNRGVARLAEGDFAAAVAANRAALRLDPDCTAARQNLVAAWNNWALALAAAGDYDAALEKISAGLAVAPGYEPLLENRVYIERRQQAAAGPSSPARSGSAGGVRDLTRRTGGGAVCGPDCVDG